MAGRTLPGLGLKGDWALGEDNWKSENDLNLLTLSTLVQARVLSIVAATPGAPVEGDIHYFDGTHPTNPNSIAIYDEAAWHYIAAFAGLQIFNLADSKRYLFSGGALAEIAGGGASALDDLSDVDVTTTPPTDGQALVFSAGTWVPGTVSGGGGGSGETWKGARVRMSADVTAAAAVISWGIEDIDVGGWFDSATDATIFTVPAGVTRVRLGASVGTADNTGTTTNAMIEVDKGAGWVSGIEYGFQTVNSSNVSLILQSGPIDVAAGWKFRVKPAATDTSITLKADRTNFWIEAIPDAAAARPAFQGALLKLSADLTSQDYTAAPVIGWDAEEYDTDGFHDLVTNPSRITIPAGVSKVRLSYNVALTSINSGAFVYPRLHKNGSMSFIGQAVNITDASLASPQASGSTAVINVAEGDYFELAVGVESDSAVTLSSATSWFAIEVLE